MKKRILVSGGPVHANLDAVKIITNKFKGGLMARLAEDLSELGADVTFLASSSSAECKCNTVHHNGFDSYMEIVKSAAKEYDAMILGAAVCNLIPANPWKDKFPSHNYHPGDIVNVPFKVAPRVIEEVKKINPRITLIGFKLLSGVPTEELLRAARLTLVESRADCVIANDARRLDEKFAVCKDFSVHALTFTGATGYAKFIFDMIQDVHYTTETTMHDLVWSDYNKAYDTMKALIACQSYKDKFLPNETGMIFGAVAVRAGDGFLTTSRGKRDMEKFVEVIGVVHSESKPTVYVGHGDKKATLNAPLLDWLFKVNRSVEAIVHYHGPKPDGVTVVPWAPPGTLRDSTRDLPSSTTFYIENHGTFELLTGADIARLLA